MDLGLGKPREYLVHAGDRSTLYGSLNRAATAARFLGLSVFDPSALYAFHEPRVDFGHPVAHQLHRRVHLAILLAE